MKQVLDISQMQHLKELGVDTSKASMKWVNKYQNAFGDDWEKVPVSVNLDTEYYQSFGYAFTLQDILDLLPHRIVGGDLCTKKRNLNGGTVWSIAYRDTFGQCPKSIFEENLIDAAYKMLCWCIENGYISLHTSN